jgi:hypothetical protein
MGKYSGSAVVVSEEKRMRTGVLLQEVDACWAKGDLLKLFFMYETVVWVSVSARPEDDLEDLACNAVLDHIGYVLSVDFLKSKRTIAQTVRQDPWRPLWYMGMRERWYSRDLSAPTMAMIQFVL